MEWWETGEELEEIDVKDFTALNRVSEEGAEREDAARKTRRREVAESMMTRRVLLRDESWG
jgi:hypothetical protein